MLLPGLTILKSRSLSECGQNQAVCLLKWASARKSAKFISEQASLFMAHWGIMGLKSDTPERWKGGNVPFSGSGLPL